MYFVDAIKFPFNSQGIWGKVGMAFLLLIIPIVNIFGMLVLLGYGIKITGRVMNGDEELPEFELGSDAGRGLLLFLMGLLYNIPSFLLSLVTSGSGDGTVLLGTSLLVALLSLLVSAVYVVGLCRYAVTGEAGVFFQFGENLNYVTANPGAYIMFLINGILYGIVIAILISIGFVLLIIPGVIMAILSMFSSYYLYARYAEAAGISGKSKRVTI